MAIPKLGVSAFVDVAAQGFQKGAGKSRAGVAVLEKALWGLLKEGVFHRRTAGGAPVEVSAGFWSQFA
jgi:hypothetical protein